MNIYAIRDRLIDYFQQPFVGPDDKNVLASVARLINNGEITSDIAQAPHHFEVWRLGQVTEDGHLVPGRELLQDCAALIRPGIRHSRITGGDEAPGAEVSRHRGPESLGGANGADLGPVPGKTPGGQAAAPETHPAAGRGPSR